MLGTSGIHQRIDYATSVVAQQLYQQNLYQASNATRTIEAGIRQLGSLTAGAFFQRTGFRGDGRVTGAWNTPQLTASVAPTRVFGLPVYASIDNDFSYLPFREINDGKVENEESARFEVAPAVRAALSRLSFLTVNTSASYRTTYFSRSADARGTVTTEPLTRRYLLCDRTSSVRSFKDLGYAGQPFQRAQEAFDRTDVRARIHPADFKCVPRLEARGLQRRDFGNTARVTYGLNNRFLYRARTGRFGRSTIQFLTVGADGIT